MTDLLFSTLETGGVGVQETPPAEIVDWGVHAVRAEAAWTRTRGEGVTVAVIDTGWVDHPDLAGAENRGPSGWADENGHAHHVAGIIGARDNRSGVVGVAPRCRLLVYAALPGGDARVAACILQAVEDGADVINLSLGASGAVWPPLTADAVRGAHAAGVVVVAAAGNDPRWVLFPASMIEVIAVSALGPDMARASFAPLVPNHAAMPGVAILSCWTGGRYARVSGTSQAAPILSGICALILALEGPGRGPRAHETVARELARVARDSSDLLYRAADLEALVTS